MAPKSKWNDPIATERRIQDAVHGWLSFEPYVWKVVDTEHFQRLRDIKQLGTSYYVWPGASHNRFEHSLGTAYLAHSMVMHLKQSQPSLEITDRDVKCVVLAGLCHDLGHGPWSHVWDTLYIPRALKGTEHEGWQHEDASEMMFDDMVVKNNISLPEDEINFIKALIAGDSKRPNCREEKPFLFEIVANKRNGMDVDKFDYMVRDGRAVGKKRDSFERLITSARAIDNQICYDHKDANQIYEIFHNRFSLHKTIYNHKTATAIEYMLIDAVLAAEPTLKIAEQIKDPERYIHLTDSIKTRIEIEDPSKPGIAKAQKILKRIAKRDLYKCVDSKVFDYEDKAFLQEAVTPAEIVRMAKTVVAADMVDDDDEMAWEEAEKAFTQELKDELEEDHVIVSMATMHYGMKDKNPLDFIMFYSKNEPGVCSQASRGDHSTLQPKCFAEVLLRIFTKHTHLARLIQAGYRKCLHERTSPYPDDSVLVSASDSRPVSPSTSPEYASGGSDPSTSQQVAVTPKREFKQTTSISGSQKFNLFHGRLQPHTSPGARTSHSRNVSSSSVLPTTSTADNVLTDGGMVPKALFSPDSARPGKRVREGDAASLDSDSDSDSNEDIFDSAKKKKV